jgi:HAMP domain-containing protein
MSYEGSFFDGQPSPARGKAPYPQSYADAGTPFDGDDKFLPMATPEELGLPVRYPRGPWGWWLRLSLPRPSAADLLNAARREQLRRAQILSTLLAATLIVVLILTPLSFSPSFNAGTLAGVVMGALIVLISMVLCRTGRVTAASTVYVLGITLAIAVGQSIFPDNKIGLQDIEPFDLFVVPIVFAGILLPRVASILIWVFSAIFTVTILSVIPHRANLDQYLNGQGIYAVAVQPILLAAILAVVSWVAAGSVNRAIMQADRTAEVARAYQAMADQKQRLEDAVAIIREVHARVANGDLTARAPIVSGELVSLAVSLNLMLERLARSQAAETALGDLEYSIQRLNEAASDLAQGQIARSLPQHGFGPLAPIAYNLEQVRHGFVQVARNSAAMVDRISTTTHEVLSINRSLIQALLQQANVEEQSYTRGMQERLAALERDLTAVIEQLRVFLARFTA